MNIFSIPLVQERILLEYNTQNLAQMRKRAVSEPNYNGKFSKANINSFMESSSDDFFLIYVKVFLKFQGNVVKMDIEKRHFGKKNLKFAFNFAH